VSESNVTPAPLLALCGDVLGREDDLRGAAHQSVLRRTGRHRDEPEEGRAIGRADRDPATTVRELDVAEHPEAQTLPIEARAPVQVADVHRHVVKPEMGLLPIQANGNPVQGGTARHPARL
jgi:hypothetical protein